jgi:hypothetical protein
MIHVMQIVEFVPHSDQFPRFDAKVDKSGDCWIWTAARNDSGYGVFGLGKKHGGSLVYAHRFSYARVNGPIERDLVIDHLCRVALCVNPDHLEQVTIWTNTQRGESRVGVFKEFCIHGHPLSGSNLYVSPSGTRGCRECQRKWSSEYKKRHRAAS